MVRLLIQQSACGHMLELMKEICRLRTNCEGAYLKAKKEEKGRTIDVIRILLKYGLHVMAGSVENSACLVKSVKQATRNLLREITELGSSEPGSIGEVASSLRAQQVANNDYSAIMRQGDWICPKCNFLNFAKNMQCLRCNGQFKERCYQKLNEDNAHLPLKKGDWICKKCNFLNFAKNTLCLRCHEKPTDRELSSWEWECVSCNYVNFRRNEYCLKCKLKRFKSSNNGRNDEKAQPDTLERESISFVQEASNGGSIYGDSMVSKQGTDDLENLNLLFVDSFPILGGKSNVSKDPWAREKWKAEMSQKLKHLQSRDTVKDCGSPARVPVQDIMVTSECQDTVAALQIDGHKQN